MSRFELSPSQLNICAQELAVSGSDVNVLYFVLKIDRPIDEQAMREASVSKKKSATIRFRNVMSAAEAARQREQLPRPATPVTVRDRSA